MCLHRAPSPPRMQAAARDLAPRWNLVQGPVVSSSKPRRSFGMSDPAAKDGE
jgi:hypothetical protein